MPTKGTNRRTRHVCEQCRTAFETFPSEDGRFCSRKCVGAATAAKRFTKTAEERFWEKVNKNGPTPDHRPELGPCWIWTAARNNRGYGFFSIGGRPRLAHRFAYSLTAGHVPDEQRVRHECDNGGGGCVRPDHLVPGTQGDNVRDMIARGRNNPGDRSRAPKGDRHYLSRNPERSARAKFTPEQILRIRAAYASGEFQYADLAAKWAVHEDTIGQIVRRKTYRHVS